MVKSRERKGINLLEYVLYIADSDDIEYPYEKELIREYLKGEIKNKEELQARLKEILTRII